MSEKKQGCEVSELLNLTIADAGMQNVISQITAVVQGINHNPSQKFAVLISNEERLLGALWTLIKSNITCIPIDPVGAFDEQILEAEGVVFVLTEKEHAHRISKLNKVLVDNNNNDSRPETNPPNDCQLTFPIGFLDVDQRNNRILSKISNTNIFEYFAQLDRYFRSNESHSILIKPAVSFQTRILSQLWASSRGISVLVEPVTAKDRNPVGLPNMIFGLFHFGSYLDGGEQKKYEQLFDTVKFADENGFTAVWTPERHFNEFGGLFPNPSVLSAAIAVKTSRVQIRSGSLVSPLHHAVRIAEDWSLVDNLSNGRVAISFASGWQCDDFIFFPENYKSRHEHMLSQIKTIRELWSGNKVSYKNGLDQETEISIFPRPIQAELPIWITVSGKTETFVDAGRIGANILTHLLWQDSDELKHKIAAYRKALSDNGFNPNSRKVAVMVHTFLGEDNESVKEKVSAPLKQYIKSSTQLIQSMAKSNVNSSVSKDVAGRYGGLNDEIPPHLMDELVEIAFNRFFENSGLLGTVEKACTLIEKLKGYDVDEIAALIDFGLGKEDIMNGLEHLNRLKNLCSPDREKTSSIGVTHCTSQALIDSKEQPALYQFFKNQKAVLIDSDDITGIPKEFYSKVNRVKKLSSDSELAFEIEPLPELNTVSMFTSSVGDEF